MNLITAIILSWKRTENIPKILDQLTKCELVSEIILWNNNPKISLKYKHPKITHIQSGKNFGTLSRYSVAFLSSNEHIFIQDDDLLLYPQQIKQLFKEYQKDDTRLYGCFGRNINNQKYIKQDVYGQVDIILGRTIMFHKRHLHKLFRALGNHQSHLEDDILFSLSLHTKHYVVDVGEIHELPNHHALSKRSDHLRRRQIMLDYCLKHV